MDERARVTIDGPYIEPMRADERADAYLASIRRMMMYSVILTALVLIAVVAAGLVELHAINSPHPFG